MAIMMNEEEYLSNRLDDQIDWYDRKSGINKKMYQRCQLVQLVVASLITLSALLETFEHASIPFIVPSMGALVAIISGILGLYKFQENWVEYRSTSEALKYEKYLFLTQSEPYHKPDRFNLLVNRAEALMAKQNSSWFQNSKEAMGDEQGVN